MEDVNPTATEEMSDQAAVPTPEAPAPPITSRFLFVDVAAMRAKQLRRGARPRLDPAEPVPKKAERIAMEEVRQGLVYFDIVDQRKPSQPEGAA